MNKDSQPQQEQDSFSVQVETFKKMASIIPSDTAQLTKSIFNNMEKESTKALKEESIAKVLQAAKKICDFYELLFSIDDNKLTDSLCQLDFNQLSKSKKRKYELFVKELTKLESEIDQDKLIARRVLNNLMEDIGICTNLQKSDYPETKDHISILRDVDFRYGQLNHPIPLSVFVNVFMLVSCCTIFTSKDIKAKEIQEDILDLFKKNDSETAELLRRIMDNQSKLSDELKTKTNEELLQKMDMLLAMNQEQRESVSIQKEKKRKRKHLTQVVAAQSIRDAFSVWYALDRRLMAIKTPTESVLKQRFSEWNSHIDNNSDDIRTQPYPGYEEAKTGDDPIKFHLWALSVFAPLYFKIEIEKAKRKKEKRISESNERDYIFELYNKVQDADFQSFKEIMRLAIKHNKLDEVSDAIRNTLPAYEKIIDFINP